MAVQASERATYFQLDSFVDAMNSSQHWLAAIVREVDASKGVLVQFDGWSSKWNEWLSQRSLRLAPFRKNSRGYGGQPQVAARDWTYSDEEVRQYLARLQQLPDSVLSEFASAYEITQWFRGRLFTLIDNLLAMLPESQAQATLILELFEAVLRFSVRWIQQLPLRYAALYQNLTNPDAYLTDKECAYAEIWPELFITVERLLGSDPRPMSFANSDVSEEFVTSRLQILPAIPEETKEIPLLAHLISFFQDTGGFQALEQLLTDETL